MTIMLKTAAYVNCGPGSDKTTNMFQYKRIAVFFSMFMDAYNRDKWPGDPTFLSAVETSRRVDYCEGFDPDKYDVYVLEHCDQDAVIEAEEYIQNQHPGMLFLPNVVSNPIAAAVKLFQFLNIRGEK